MGTPQISAVSVSVSAVASPVSSPDVSLQLLPRAAATAIVGKPSPLLPAGEPQPLGVLTPGDSFGGSMELSHAAAQLVEAVRISDPFLKPVAVPLCATRHEETALVSAFAAAAAVGFDDRAASLASEAGAAEAMLAAAAGSQRLAPELSASSAGSLSLPRGSAASGGRSSSTSRASSSGGSREPREASRHRSCGSQLEQGGSATLMIAAPRQLSSCLTA